MTAPAVTAVVCTHNRAAYLPACLDSLLRQDLPRERFEILVVDNASTDDTAAVCLSYQDRGVRRIHDSVPGLSHARNVGWRAARGALVAYLDDDAIACESWLSAAVAAFRSVIPPPDGLGGAVRLQWDLPEPAWMNAPLRQPLGEVDWGPAPRKLLPSEWIIGANCFYSRTCLERLNGFDERLGRKGSCLLSGEETLLQRRIEEAGGFLYYVPAAAIRHRVTPDRTRPAWFYRRYFWGGVSDAVLRRTAPAGGTAAAAAPVAGPAGGSALVRVAINFLASLGLARAPRRIQARIYMAYVVGWCLGRAGWKR